MLKRSIEFTLFSDTPKADLEAAKIIDPFETVEKRELISFVGMRIAELSEREKVIIKSRYFGDSTQRSHKKIGIIFGVTPERIRQIEKRSSERLFRQLRRENLDPTLSSTDYARRYLNGVVNACYQGQFERALHNLALAKATLIYNPFYHLEAETIVPLLENPLYPGFTDQEVDNYLKQFTIHYGLARSAIRNLEQGRSQSALEVRNLDSMVKKRFNTELEQAKISHVATLKNAPLRTQPQVNLPEKTQTAIPEESTPPIIPSIITKTGTVQVQISHASQETNETPNLWKRFIRQVTPLIRR